MPRTEAQLLERARRQRDYVARNRDTVNAKQRAYHRRPEVKVGRAAYRHANLVKGLLSEARKRAKRKGLAFNLTERDVAIPEVCPVLGIPIIPRGPRANWPSLDRHIPALGYVVGNVFVISHRANNLKNDASIDEVRRILAYMVGRA